MQQNKTYKKIIYRLAILLFWIGVWQCAYLLVDMDMLVASPSMVLKRLWELMVEKEFWISSFTSLLRITVGYVAALFVGTLMGVITSASDFLRQLFSPILSLIRSTPVASFILLALVWIKRDSVAVFISFLMALPVVWANVSEGIKGTDRQLLEMARLYSFSLPKKLKMIYLHSVMPFFAAGAITSLGLAWKAGVAAEVLSTPMKSIGYNLYRAKINIETTDLFAWTAVVILLSVAFEKIVVLLLGRLQKKSTEEEKTDDKN